MKAVRFHQYGGPEVLRYEEADRPRPAAGQVLVEVAATSFNPVDAAIRAGYLQEVFPVALPHTPGIDVAGTVIELGDGVQGHAVGERVIAYLPMLLGGAAAEFAVVPAELVAPAPTTIPLAEAAALPAAAQTAWQALFDHADLRADQRILVNGAGGGVGGFAIQLAKQAGATVLATASARSTEAVRAAGADRIVDYTATAVTTAVTEPVDVVLNLANIGEPDIAALTGLVRSGGTILSTATPAVGDAGRGVRGLGMQLRPDVTQLAAITKKVDTGELRVDVSAGYPLAEIAAVHQLSAAGRIRGKVVLTTTA
ncbi:NADP-dependent oxidoreductase [Amycolatopsis sp. NBC_00355]|uniref:NADP-dependent oxidoreductase n=1 Tax=Amycolatopsis sp. NBC_00355 TaxID=2975957 RepID=UPI002E274320